MKKNSLLYLAIALLPILFGCGSQKVAKYLEEGVEVIVNHIAPYSIEGEPSSLLLEELLILDTEDPAVAEAGLVDINAFQVDSQGNIYLLSLGSEKFCFYKFTPEGRFVTAFGPKGQGPGELGFPLFPRMLPNDRLAVTDVLKKLLVFASDGTVAAEDRIDPNFIIISPLANGSSLVFWKAGTEDATAEHYNEKVSLFGPDEREIQELDRLDVGRQVRFLDPVFSWHVSREAIFLLNEQRDYEVLVFSHDGSLVRKIQKQYTLVRLEGRFLEALLEGIPENSPQRAAELIPEFLPPAHALFSDAEGRLYVGTFEAGERRGEYWFDVFNRDGVFFARVSLPVFFGRDPFPVLALVRNGNLYCVSEKESGYKWLKVYRMSWH